MQHQNTVVMTETQNLPDNLNDRMAQLKQRASQTQGEVWQPISNNRNLKNENKINPNTNRK